MERTWVKVIKVPSEGKNIYCPRLLNQVIAENVNLKYGLKNVWVNVQFHNKNTNVPCSFENPYVLFCSQEVIKALHIVEGISYQLKWSENNLQLGPVIGFLLGEHFYTYNQTYLKGLTRGMSHFKEVGGLCVAFKNFSVDWHNQCIYGLFYVDAEKKWKYGVCPLPSVVFRRAFLNTQKTVDHFMALTGNKVFNSRKFDKWEVYQRLVNEPSFSHFMPLTQKVVSFDALNIFLHAQKKIILKPAALSRGRGICFIRKLEDCYYVNDYREDHISQFYVASEDLERFVEKNFIKKNYIMQEEITLSRINGAPFDIRVVMGKNTNSKWACRGIECRVAGPKSKLTNLSRGGQALFINSALKQAFGEDVIARKKKQELIQIATEFCTLMDAQGEHFAEFGLDFAIDPNQNYWFIEANVRPVFRGFKRLSVRNYRYIRHMPLEYAAGLDGFHKGASQE